MSLDLSFAKTKLAELESLEQELRSPEVNGLFDREHLQELSGSIGDLRKRIAQNEEKDRLLRIGIIGDVKAGKSSFLNANLFEGKDFLPKAATPMTAALTRICYHEAAGSEAIIHFYSQTDWEKITDDAYNYDRKLDELYRKYLEEHAKKAAASAYSQNRNAQTPPMTKEKFERINKSRIPNPYCVAKEIVSMMRSGIDVRGKLGSEERVAIDAENLSESLDDYVGAKGTYTSIVSYVELKIHDDLLKGLEVIDTPGLNDPIQSRCEKTKEFLGECNVAILLSPCSQFMDEQTVQMMLRRLPAKNIAEIQVIGSQIDSGMQDLIGQERSLRSAYDKTAYNCRSQLKTTIETAERSYLPNSVAVQSLKKNGVLFTSSICYSMYGKMKKGIPLNKEEDNVREQLLQLNSGKQLSPDELLEISGHQKVKELLARMREERARILENDSRSFLHTCTLTIAAAIETIQEEAIMRKRMLERNDIQALRDREKRLLGVIDSSRTKIYETFQLAAFDAKQGIDELQDDFAQMQKVFSDIKEDKTTRIVTRKGERKWWDIFGIFTETYQVPVTDRKAATADVIRNIDSFRSKCISNIRTGFKQGFLDDNKLKSDLLKIFLDALDDGGETDPEDILSPIRILLAKIKTPDFNISIEKYIDSINNRFPAGYAENDGIYILQSMQQDSFFQITEELKKQLEGILDTIRNVMLENSATFADQVKKKLSGNFDELKEQLEDKEASLKKYDDFIRKFSDYKAKLLEH